MNTKIKNAKIVTGRSREFNKPLKIAAVAGCGTFAVQNLVRASKIAVDTGSSGYLTYGIAVDNNLHSVNTANETLRKLRPSLFKRMTDRFYKYAYQASVEKLPAVRTAIGFDRELEASMDSIKIFRQTINNVVKRAKDYDFVCGNTTAIQFRPTSLSGGHAGAPQWLLNHEMNMQGLDGLRIGLAAIPSEIMSLRIFKKVFPLMLASDRYGFDVWVLSDNNLANLHRPPKVQDELILKGLLGTLSAFTWAENQPGPGDIWRALSRESNGFVSASGVEEQIITNKGRVDREAVIEAIRRGFLRLFNDPKTQLLDAELGNSLEFIVVVGNINHDDYSAAVDQIIIPKNTTMLYAPCNSNVITLVRFSALKGSIKSVERLWSLDACNGKGRYKLPNNITEKAIGELWPMVEKVADYAGVTPEVLLEGN